MNTERDHVDAAIKRAKDAVDKEVELNKQLIAGQRVILLSMWILLGSLVFIVFCLSGCSTLRTLEPDTLPVELTHVSHLTQHFGANPTNYGYDALSIGAKWKPLKNLSISVSEGVILESRQTNTVGEQWCGALYGPREVFTGKIAYEIPLK